MSMDTAIDVTVVSLNIWNVVLNSMGAYLLICLYKEGLKTPQQIYLLNLTLSELTINLLELVRRLATKAVGLTGTNPDNVVVMNSYILIIMFTGVSPVFYLSIRVHNS